MATSWPGTFATDTLRHAGGKFRPAVSMATSWPGTFATFFLKRGDTKPEELKRFNGHELVRHLCDPRLRNPMQNKGLTGHFAEGGAILTSAGSNNMGCRGAKFDATSFENMGLGGCRTPTWFSGSKRGSAFDAEVAGSPFCQRATVHLPVVYAR